VRSRNYEFDLSQESPLSRADIAALLARWQGRSKPLHLNQITRLMRTGVRGIPLPSVLVGNRRISTVEACHWWISATSAVDASDRGIRTAVAPLTPQQRATLMHHGVSKGGGGQ
jgi:Protein of unknown function (DUF1580)